MKKIALILFLSVSGGFAGLGQNKSTGPVVNYPVYFDVSPPLRDLQQLPVTATDLTWKDGIVKNKFRPGKKEQSVFHSMQPSVKGIQSFNGAATTDTTAQNFDGIANPNGYIPPDTHGDVGPNHYMQVVNASYAVFSKTGTNLSGIHATSTIWSGMPNNSNSGDAVVLYDEQADRWLISQFSLPNFPNGPFYQMIAVSQSNDPMGSWNRYQYSFNDLPDYPKFGIWPDGYYMSTNLFSSGALNWAGCSAIAYDRTKMIAGLPAPLSVVFTLPATGNASSILPSDCDGPFPATGTPDYFSYIFTSPGPNYLGTYEFHTDWTAPVNSTFSNFDSLPVNSFNNFSGVGISQMGSSQTLDPIDDRLMYRLQYRKFSNYEAMVCNHTVNMGSNQAGIRWYELRKTGSGWTVYQQSTYAPDTRSRWMGSIAMDTAGTIALGYSVSGSTMYPSIRYTGRLKTDPLNTMTYTEHGIFNGGGAQTHYSGRWGDYSAMSTDPANPGTFWYTTEYYASTSSTNWRTRIASFALVPSNVFTILATATPSQINVGSSSQLSVAASGGTGTYTYSWTSIPAGYTSGIQDPVVSPLHTTKYVAHVTSGPQTLTDTAEVIVTLAVAATASPTALCLGGSAQLSCTPSGGSGNYTYAWTSVPPGYNSSIQNPIVVPSVNTEYKVAVNDGTNIDSAQAVVAVKPPPTAYAGGDTIVCGWATMFRLGGAASSYSSVLWTTNGDGIFGTPALLSTTYTPGAGDKLAGLVNITLTASPVNPCANSAIAVKHVILDPCTGVETRHNGDLQLTLSPNPAGNSVKLLVNGAKGTDADYTFTAIDGKIHLSGNSPLQLGSLNKALDVSALPKGIYIVKVVAGPDVASCKLIIL